MPFDRITFEANKLGGKACIRGLRISVATILRCLASDMTVGDVLEAYPDLDHEDIRQALEFAARLAEDRQAPVPEEHALPWE